MEYLTLTETSTLHLPIQILINRTEEGFSFEELRKMIQKSISTRIVVILDCCYSGSAKVSKGNEEDAAKIGRTTIEERSRKLLEGQGRYILSASQAASRNVCTNNRRT